MALRKIVEAEGPSFIQSSIGKIEAGIKKVTFVAVCKVTSVTGSKDCLNINVSYISDVAKYECSYFFEPSVADGSPNFIKQAYLHLKTLPEFAGAEDC